MKMFEIIEIGEDSLKEVSTFFPMLQKQFPSLDFVAYVVKTEKGKGFLFKQNEKGIFFFPNSSYLEFTMNAEGLLSEIVYEDVVIDYETDSIKKGDMVFSLQIDEVEEESYEYNGEVVFSQVNEKTEECCLISYPHMFYKNKNISPIYSNHTKEKSRITFLSKRKNEDYIRYTIDSSSILYGWIQSREKLVETEEINRYFRLYTLGGHSFADLFFHAGETIEEMNKKILDRGFLTEIPTILYEVYNDNNQMFQLLSTILIKAREIDEKEDNYRRMLLSLKED